MARAQIARIKLRAINRHLAARNRCCRVNSKNPPRSAHLFSTLLPINLNNRFSRHYTPHAQVVSSNGKDEKACIRKVWSQTDFRFWICDFRFKSSLLLPIENRKSKIENQSGFLPSSLLLLCAIIFVGQASFPATLFDGRAFLCLSGTSGLSVKNTRCSCDISAAMRRTTV